MKLKNTLMLTFLGLTITPILIMSVLLYQSGFDLAKELYTNNLTESINVQADYISQTMKNNMISDYRFANQVIANDLSNSATSNEQGSELFTSITSYLRSAEDKINVATLLDDEHTSIYSVGEKAAIDTLREQLPEPSHFKEQEIVEFNLDDGSQSLGVVTPVWKNDTYLGCLVSVYNETYIFKIISSYYEMADTSTYICRKNGDIINSSLVSKDNTEEVKDVLHSLNFTSEGIINTDDKDLSLSGYYKNIYNTPWYLVSFTDDELIYSFTNKFLLYYVLIIVGVLIVDIILSFYFSRRVVKPINRLIDVMEGYRNTLDVNKIQYQEEGGYVETKYLRTKFLELMQKILLTQHNFEGIYQLYQSNDMGDININIDVSEQSITSNKDSFGQLIETVEVPEDACVVEKFTHCFCEKDQKLLMQLFEAMRDEHLSTTQELEVFSPYYDGKWYQILVAPMYNNERLSRLFIQLRDVSNFKKQEIESSEQAKRDALTGLYNRSGFTSNVNQILQTKLDDSMHALLFIDMDYFKLVNDNFGHAEGDHLLRTIADEISKIIGTDDIVSRFGGDEFVIFLTDTSSKEVVEMQDKLKEVLIYPFKTETTSFVVTASIGVSMWEQGSDETLESLLKEADNAMYRSKREFKDELK